jgi:hypothetical protein
MHSVMTVLVHGKDLQQHQPGCCGLKQVEGQSDGAGIVLTLESKDCTQLEAARQALIDDLPAGSILAEQRNSMTLNPTP